MGTTNDFLISMVKCIQDMESSMKSNTREQLTRMDLISIRAYCSSCLSYTKDNYIPELFSITANIQSVIELCTSSLNDVKFTETDIEEKEFIQDKIDKAMIQLCLLSGKYYCTENRFVMKSTMLRTYNLIIDVCLNNSYYFGIDDKIRRGEV